MHPQKTIEDRGRARKGDFPVLRISPLKKLTTRGVFFPHFFSRDQPV